MFDILLHTSVDALWDTLKLFPFLLATYLVLEYLEEKAGDKTLNLVQKSGRLGVPVGALCGLVPQCGLAAAASNFYAARVISGGALIAVFLSTSDEMLPILISNAVSVKQIIKILSLKVVAGLFWGISFDLICRHLLRLKPQTIDVETLCHNEQCQCEQGGILKSALNHSFKISLFVFIVTWLFNLLVITVGVSSLAVWISHPVIGPMVSGLVGLIPNCSASVVVTQLYLEKAITFGTMMSGLLVGAGVGLLVLFRVNPRMKENLLLTLYLYVAGVISGCLIDALL